MIEQIARAIAKADGADFDTDPARFRRLALAALKPLARPTEAMVDAAHQAVWFDAFWAINRWADFRKAVRAMIEAAIGRFPGNLDQGDGGCEYPRPVEPRHSLWNLVSTHGGRHAACGQIVCGVGEGSCQPRTQVHTLSLG
jgi:hypothetical protein